MGGTREEARSVAEHASRRGAQDGFLARVGRGVGVVCIPVLALALSALLSVAWPRAGGSLLANVGFASALLLLTAHLEIALLVVAVAIVADAAVGWRKGRLFPFTALVVWALVTLDVGSWGLRLLVGLDLNRDYLVTFAREWRKLVVVTTAAERWALFSLPLVGAVVAALLFVVPRPRTDRSAVRPAAIALAGLAAAVAIGHLVVTANRSVVWEASTGRWTTVAEVYTLAFRGRGPWLPQMFLAGGSRPALDARRPENAPYVRVGEPLYTLEQWAATIDRSRFRPKNVVLIQIDSLRWNELAQAGGDPRTLPNLSRLAGENILFDRCYTPTSETAYSLPAMLDGQYALRRPSRDYHEDVSYPGAALAEVLRAAGYRTALFSSHWLAWQKMDRVIRPEQYDTYIGLRAVPSLVASGQAPPWLRTVAEQARIVERIDHDVDSANDFDAIGEELFSAWAAADGHRPFFAVLAQIAAHYPYRWPPELKAPFTPFERSEYTTFFSYPLEAVGVMRNAYRNALHYDDLVLERVMATLTRLGVRDDTIVVIASDHAQSFGEHGLVTHARGPYESQIRTPITIVGASPTPARTDRPVSMIDIAPTVLDILGLPEYGGFQGFSVFDGAHQRTRPIYFSMQSPMTKQEAVIADGLKYIEDFANGTLSCFDLVHDPGETRNLMDQPRPPALALRLQRDLRAWHLSQLIYYASPELNTKFFPPRYTTLTK